MALRRSAAALRGAAEWVLNDASRPLASKAAAHASNAGAAIEYDIPTAYAGHRVEPPSSRVTTSPEELIDLFRTMYLMRRIEIGSDTLYKSKFIRGFCHLYDGQEAVAAGMERALTYDDAIITAYRDHCIHLGRGGTPLEIMAELMGRTSGASNGKGGSMHLYHKRNNYYGGCGIVGAQTPLGAGLAFALKYEGKADNVCFCLYGDGAANQGQLFESYNLAALWDLPIVYVCENNHYGMGTAKHRASKSPEYYTRGDFVPGLKVDGMDALCVKQACEFAKSYASRNGPIILEMDTYRYHGHSMSDPGSTYRSREEISGVRQQRDPVERVKQLIFNHQIMSQDEVKAIEKEQRKKVDDAIEEGKQSVEPDMSELATDMYANPLTQHVRGVEYEQRYPVAQAA